MVSRLFICLLLVGNPLVCAAQGVPLITVQPEKTVEVVELSTLEGQASPLKASANSLTVVHFWATWCVPCRKELPLLVDLSRRYQGQDVRFIAVAADSHTAVKVYLQKYPLELPVLIDQYGKAMHQYSVRGLPSSYVVDRKGVIRYQVMGMVDWRLPVVDRKLGSLLAE